MTRQQKGLFYKWRKLSITVKFGFAFFLLLSLILLVSITGYIALTLVSDKTESAILTSTEIERTVLEMKNGLEEARRLHRDFFLKYPEIGFVKARELYAQPSVLKIAGVITLSKNLKHLIARSNVSGTLQKEHIDLNLYLSSAKRFSDTFLESVELVTTLAAPERGLQARLQQTSETLQEMLVQTADYQLSDLYRDMRAFEKDYWITRQRPFMQSAFNVIFHLRKAVKNLSKITPSLRAQIMAHFDQYVDIAEQILKIDVEIQRKFNDFTLQAAAVDPISAKLIELSKAEVEHARNQIRQTSQLVTVILIITTLAGLFIAIMIARILNNSITRNLVRLTESARKLQEGNLDISAQIDSLDEIGELASSFNEMAARIRTLVNHLEQKVAERTYELEVANKEITALNERLKAENLRMGAELDVARRLQKMILPKTEELKQIEGLDIVGFMEPADEVGGDYYDVLLHEGVIKIGIGDVTGHGLESGVLMLMTQTAVRTLLLSGETDPKRFLSILNHVIYDNVQRMNADKSMTLALLDYKAGQVRLSGQHEEMIVVRQDGKHIELVDTIDLGFPIGLDKNISDFVHEATVLLQPGEGIVLYSDGITEAENIHGELYGLPRLCNIVSQYWENTATDVKEAVIRDVHQYIGEQRVYDDLTLVVLKQQ